MPPKKSHTRSIHSTEAAESKVADDEEHVAQKLTHKSTNMKTDDIVEQKVEEKRNLRSSVSGKDPADKHLHDQPHRTVKRTKSDDSEPASDTPKKKKQRRSVIDKPGTKFHQVANEANRGIVEMLNDMAGKHFLLGEKQQGIACETAAKSMRETEKVIRSGEAAEHFRGIGDHISHYIEEFLETGKVKHLEDLHRRVDEANDA